MAMSLDMSLVDQLGLSQKTQLQAKEKERLAKGKDLGEDAFLKLMLAQLKNQDPMKPMENGEFLTQLAQFKSVAGIDDMKNSFDKFAGQMQSNQALQASSMVGRWVLAPGSSSYMWDKRPYIEGAVNIPSSTSSVTLHIYTADGQLQRTIDLGSRQSGMSDFIWDGADDFGNPLPAGKYQIKASAEIDGKSESLKVFTANPVESVTLNKGGGEITLNVSGVGKVSMNDVEKIM